MKTLPTILTAAIVSFGVATVASPAAKAPPTHGISTAALSDLRPTSGPSLADKVEALTKRLNTVQTREAQDRANLNQIALATDNAVAVTSCIVSALYMVKDDSTGAFVEADPSDPNGDYVATLDDACITDGQAP